MGDAAILVQFGDRVDPLINRRVHALDRRLRSGGLEGVIEAVPAYASLLVHYDPLLITYDQVSDWVKTQVGGGEESAATPARRIEVPVRYGGEHGPDLESVAAFHRLSPRKIAQLHAGRDYLVYMMGFTPGFPYLGTLDAAIATPRLETPRTRVPAGSVAIAGDQTGIYPVDSPGGWRLLGRTELTLFDPAADSPFLFSPGDRVRFLIEAIDA